ncbi:hypothetical protein GWI33_008134, partial [Rhynchophorus ferrugineus]
MGPLFCFDSAHIVMKPEPPSTFISRIDKMDEASHIK